jgi:Tfp pilus assembly PilM family ATPase
MIVVELASDRIRVADVEGVGRSARVSAAFSLPLPQELAPQSVEALAAWLRGQFENSKLRKGDCVCVLGRGVVVLKTIRVPVVPDNELAGVVAFAVEGALHLPGPTTVDFQPGPIHPAADGQPSDEQEVAAAVASAAVVETVKGMLAKAGLPCRRMGVRPFAVRAGCRVETSGDGGAVALLYTSPETLELSIWTGGHLRSCRWMAPASSTTPDRIANEVRRTLAAFHAQSDGANVAKLLAAGADAPSLVGPLKTALSNEVEMLDVGEVAAEHAAALGAAALAASRAPWPIDLLRPKRVSAAVNPSRRTLILAGAFVLVLVVGGALQLLRAFSARNDQINLLTARLAQMDQEIARFKPITDRHATLAEWVESADPILDELQEVAAILPDTSDLFLTSLEYNSGQRDSPGTIKLDGLARQQSHVTRLQTKLIEESKGRYEVVPRGLDPGADVASFVWRWGLDLAIEPLEPAGYAERSAARKETLELLKPPEGRTRNELSLARGGGGGPTTSRGGRPDRRASTVRSSDRGRPGDEERSGEGGGAATSKFFEDKVAAIRKLPPEEREEAIQSEPKFLQKRLRKAIEDAEAEAPQ